MFQVISLSSRHGLGNSPCSSSLAPRTSVSVTARMCKASMARFAFSRHLSQIIWLAGLLFRTHIMKEHCEEEKGNEYALSSGKGSYGRV